MESREAFDEFAVPQEDGFHQPRAFWPAQAWWELGLPALLVYPTANLVRMSFESFRERGLEIETSVKLCGGPTNWW